MSTPAPPRATRPIDRAAEELLGFVRLLPGAPRHVSARWRLLAGAVPLQVSWRLDGVGVVGFAEVLSPEGHLTHQAFGRAEGVEPEEAPWHWPDLLAALSAVHGGRLPRVEAALSLDVSLAPGDPPLPWDKVWQLAARYGRVELGVYGSPTASFGWAIAGAGGSRLLAVHDNRPREERERQGPRLLAWPFAQVERWCKAHLGALPPVTWLRAGVAPRGTVPPASALPRALPKGDRPLDDPFRRVALPTPTHGDFYPEGAPLDGVPAWLAERFGPGTFVTLRDPLRQGQRSVLTTAEVTASGAVLCHDVAPPLVSPLHATRVGRGVPWAVWMARYHEAPVVSYGEEYLRVVPVEPTCRWQVAPQGDRWQLGLPIPDAPLPGHVADRATLDPHAARLCALEGGRVGLPLVLPPRSAPSKRTPRP